MLEREPSGIPQERSLVALRAERGRPRTELTPGQKRIVDREVLRYLKNNRLFFNKENVGRAWVILGVDCLERGLLLAGQQEISPEESPRKFIKRGLEHREEVQVVVQEALKITDRSQVSQEGDFLGPLALEQSLIQTARREWESFLLTPQISNLDRVAVEFMVRREILTKLAEFAISTLPRETYHQASIEQFPDLEERAKIIRNLLVSLTFRQMPSPVILIEDLRLFNSQDKEAIREKFSAPLSESFWQALAEATGLPKSQVEPFLLGLKKQAEAAFLRSNNTDIDGRSQTEAEMIGIRDKFYRNFSPVLLLLHPALEEKPLITSPDQAQEDSYNLWREDFSVVIDGQRVPTTEGLHRASRLAQAKGYGEERFNEAIVAWRRYVREQKSEEQKVVFLQTEVERLGGQLSRFQENPQEPIPQSFVAVIQSRLRAAPRFISDRLMLGRTRREISGVLERKKEAEEYVQNLKQQHGGDLPETAPPPRGEFLASLEHDLTNLQRTIAIERGRLDQLAGQVGNNFWIRWLGKRGIWTLDLNWEFANADEIARKLRELRLMRRQVVRGKGPNLDLSPAELGDFKASLDQAIADEEAELGDFKRAPKQEREYLRSLQRLRTKLNEENLRPSFILGLELGYKKLKVIGQLRLKKQQNEEERQRTQDFYHNLRNTPEEEWSPQTYWSREEIETYLRETQAAPLPEEMMRSFNSQKFSTLARRLGKALTGLRGTNLPWPKVISSRVELADWVEQLVQQRKEDQEILKQRRSTETNSGEREKIRDRIWSRERQIRALNHFLVEIDNPILPFPEGSGLPADKFWSVCRRRVGFAHALVTLFILEPKVEIFNLSFERLMRDQYLAHLKSQLSLRQKELGQLEQNPQAKARLLKTMADLNLLLPMEDSDN